MLEPPVTAKRQSAWSGLPIRCTRSFFFAIVACVFVWIVGLYWWTPSYVTMIPRPGSSSSEDHRPAGVIIDSGTPPNLVPLILHFATVLGSSWRIIFYTDKDNWSMPGSPAFRRAVASKAVEIRFYPADTQLNSTSSVSKFLASPWLWEELEPAQRVLLFQADSVICSKAAATVNDFFDYDFVGAPIAQKFGEGYNGGLSLRNPKLFLDIARKADFASSKDDYEDKWFYKQCKARIEAGEDVKLPSVEVAQTFAVESIYYDRPLGYHQPKRWQAGKMGEISEWCPEVGLLAGRRVKFG